MGRSGWWRWVAGVTVFATCTSAIAEEIGPLQPARLQIAGIYNGVWWMPRDESSMGGPGAFPSFSVAGIWPFSPRWHVRGDMAVIAGGNEAGGVSGRIIAGVDFTWFGAEWGAFASTGVGEGACVFFLPCRIGPWYRRDPLIAPATSLRVGPKPLHVIARFLTGEALATTDLDFALVVASQEFPFAPEFFGSIGVTASGGEAMIGWRGEGMRLLTQLQVAEVPFWQGRVPDAQERKELPRWRLGFAVAFDLWRNPARDAEDPR